MGYEVIKELEMPVILTESEKIEKIKNADNLEKLVRVLDEIGPIIGSQGKEHKPIDIQKDIGEIMRGKFGFEKITSSLGLREQVRTVLLKK